MSRLVGARLPRVEDARLLRGRGRYVDDVQPVGLRHAAFVRSPFAHARITAVDTAVARATPEVDLVLTAAELEGVVGVMRGAGPEGLHSPAFGPLASDRVRFVGDPVAIVVAASRAAAEDACEQVDVTYEPLSAVVDVDAAVDLDAPAVFEEVGHNLMFEGHWVYGDPDARFAAAPRTGRWRFTQHRQCNAPLEGRAGVVDHDPDTGDLTYHAAHQNPHGLRLFVAELL
ncbi:MAG TPA: molybdopterin cofactor-binding domain-containing protein, partial [Acidimicrobiia bacterium]|nr:molybdopterin cofactor-binding domain-containing protein [Acidimicrobiia bacterium]